MQWDYLILTASNDRQAEAYRSHVNFRQSLGLLDGVRECLVVPDLGGRRIGSGGSTLCCLSEVLKREGASGRTESPEKALGSLRVLIVHAGGDSRRLPAYGPCGKIFVPVPVRQASLPASLFDLLVPRFLSIPPPGLEVRGQIVVAAGDALIHFDPLAVRTRAGVSVLGCLASPEEASRHGVYCIGAGHTVALYLQKPSIEQQQQAGAINSDGLTVLDAGVMVMDSSAAGAMLEAFGAGQGPSYELHPSAREVMLEYGIDLYREFCCALGSEGTLEHYIESARSSGSNWPEELFCSTFERLHPLRFYADSVPDCRFLHFGSTKQLIESGNRLRAEAGTGPIVLNSSVEMDGDITGQESWVEGCRISAPVSLAGGNVLTGLDVRTPLSVPDRVCIDLVEGQDHHGGPVLFVRIYNATDSFKDSMEKGARFMNLPLREWIERAELTDADLWDCSLPPGQRTLWNARIFPAVKDRGDYVQWLWITSPESATDAERSALRRADRYSSEEIALLADQNAFHLRRIRLWGSGAADADKVGDVASAAFHGPAS